MMVESSWQRFLPDVPIPIKIQDNHIDNVFVMSLQNLIPVEYFPKVNIVNMQNIILATKQPTTHPLQTQDSILKLIT